MPYPKSPRPRCRPQPRTGQSFPHTFYIRQKILIFRKKRASLPVRGAYIPPGGLFDPIGNDLLMESKSAANSRESVFAAPFHLCVRPKLFRVHLLYRTARAPGAACLTRSGSGWNPRCQRSFPEPQRSPQRTVRYCSSHPRNRSQWYCSYPGRTGSPPPAGWRC